jgi:hypothetical protein
MASRAVVLALAIVALAAPAVPAAGPSTAGGTIELRDAGARYPGAGPGVRGGFAVALLPDAIASGEPGSPGAAGAVRIAATDATPGKRVRNAKSTLLVGPRSGNAGRALAATSDFDGDGSDALLIGAPAAAGEAGRVFLVFDPANAGDMRLRRGRRAIATVLGAAPGDKLGAAVAFLPDVDGDRHSELVLGAPGASRAGRAGAGAAYVVLSSAATRGATIDLGDPGNAALQVVGSQAGAETGRAVAVAPHRGDIVVGAPGVNTAFVVLAPAAGIVDLADPAAPVVRLIGPPGERAGAAIAVPGDLNGDRLPEIAVGAPHAGTGPLAFAGAVYVAAGRSAPGTVALGGELVMPGAARLDHTGAALAAAGDVDRDGRPDLLVGAPDAKPLGRLRAGVAYVVFGSVARSFALLGSDGVRVAGKRGQRVGVSVAGGVDADGQPGTDMLVGAPGAAKGPRIGRAALLSGPRRPVVTAGAACAPPLAVVIDDSAAIRRQDDNGLRADALQLLLNQPANEDRVVGAVEMSSTVSEIFSPLRIVKRDDSDPQQTLLEKLVDKSAGKRAGVEGADLEAGVDGALALNERAKTALVVAGDATTTPTPRPTVRVDVLAVDVPPGSAAEQRLRALAAGSRGGAFTPVTAGQLQPAMMLRDAPNRCQRSVAPTIDGRKVRDPNDVKAVGVELDSPRLTVEAVLPAKHRYADYVFTWDSPATTLKAPSISVRGRERPPVRFRRRLVERALRGVSVHPPGTRVVLRGVRGSTSMTLRIRFLQGGATATAPKHRRIRWKHPRGGHASSAAARNAYPQLFVRSSTSGR